MPKTFEEAVREEALRVAEIVIHKQRDYGKGNIQQFGEFGVCVRLNDKVQRLANLMRPGAGEPANEPIEDSWDDVIGYGLLGRMLRRGTFDLPMGSGPTKGVG